MSDGTMSKVLGGSPLGVLARLALVSILVGVILSAFGLDPFDIVHSIQRMIRTLWDLGFDAFPLAVAVLPARRRDRDPGLDPDATGSTRRAAASPASFPR